MRRLSIVAGFAALMLGAGFLAHWLSVRSRINAEFERIRAAGEPTTIEELDAFYVYPAEDDDTTDLWLEAIAALEEPAFEEAGKGVPFLGTDVDLPIEGEDWPEIEKAEALLEKYGATLKKLHKAAATPGRTRYPLDYREGLDMPLVHTHQLRSAASLLQLEAHVRAHQGEASRAGRSIRAMLAAGRTLEQEPHLISMLVRLSINLRAIDTIERLLPKVPFSNEDLTALLLGLRSIADRAHLDRSLLAERVIYIFSAKKELTEEASDFPGRAMATWALVGKSFVEKFASIMKTTLDAVRQDWPEVIRVTKQLSGQTYGSFDAGGLLVTLSTPSLVFALQSTVREVARIRTAATAIEIERYQRARGRLPETLHQLVPEYLPKPPEDPFTGEPLRYLTEENGYVVYSVGLDGVDDGGKSDDSRGPDVVFRVSRPSAE